MSQMNETEDVPRPEASQEAGMSPWRIIGWLCAWAMVVSVVACVIMAAIRSTGLTMITVTALNHKSEPRDHKLPLIKRKEALPDYEVTLILKNGDRVHLGTKPDASAVDGLTWHLDDPVSVADVASVRLQDQDKVVSDAIAEVQIRGDSLTEDGYRFDFASERSISVGIKSFFGTPIGKAIAAGFCIAIALIFASAFCV